MEVEPPYPIYGSSACFGLDPGTSNLGIAKIYPEHRDYVALYQISFERKDRPIDRMLDVQVILRNVINYFGYEPKAVIEGAAFGNVYRQAEMAEVRASMALWLHNFGVRIEFAPPKTIRKVVFGNGNIKNPFENIPDDAAAALAAAFMAMKL